MAPRPRRGRLHSEHLPGALSIRAPARRRELRGEDEQRRTVSAAERARETAAVQFDALEHTATLGNSDAALAGDVGVPDSTLGV
jgi:hypothetical protein